MVLSFLEIDVRRELVLPAFVGDNALKVCTMVSNSPSFTE